MLNFLFADVRLLARAAGRVYGWAKSLSIDWHCDLIDNRKRGFSLNLTREEFKGGDFQIRSDKDDRIHSLHNGRMGDLLLFAISPGLAHRVTNAQSVQEKISFTG